MRIRRWHRVSARIVLATFTTSFVACGGAQSTPPTTTTTVVETPSTVPPPPTTLPPPPPAPPPSLPSQPPARLDQQGLHDLVAPVALYPDVVLSSLIPATTNPEQIHDAAAYVGQAQHVDNVPTDRGWDGSVVGLLQFPDVLRWLDANPAWTDQMGQAVTYQQGDVLQAIQDYRKQVQDAGNLKSNQYQKVDGGGGQDIHIAPARQDVVYVPSYDPVAAVQPQPAVAPGVAPGVNPWIAFGGGAVVGALGAWALYSVFSDHDHGGGNTYYNNRKIVNYNNYYYSGGQRPQGGAWQPQQRQLQNRARAGNWQRPTRLQQTAQPLGARPQQAALRPPMSAPGAAAAGAAAPTPQQVQREQRQQRQAEQQQRQQQQREQKQTDRQQRQDAKRQQQEQQRQQKTERRQQQQTDQAQRRQQQQEQRQQRRQQNQENQAKQREQRQTERQQNQAAKHERQQERQENRAQQQQQKKNKKGH
jgi:hypothetical protein